MSNYNNERLIELEARLAEALVQASVARRDAQDAGMELAEAEALLLKAEQNELLLVEKLDTAEALLREAREVLREEEVNCCCHEAYTSRNMIDPNCRFHEQDTLRAAAARIDTFLGSKS